MGDRGNVKVGGVYLYTHWCGSSLLHIVHKALKRQLRWTDEAYLTRIIFCEMIKGEESGETGFGISTIECEPENPTIEVNTGTQTVRVGGSAWSFEDFIKVDLGEDA